MRVIFANLKTHEIILQLESDVVPSTTDILVMPDSKVYRVMQRAFIAETVRTKTVDLSKGQQLQVTIQLGMLPVVAEQTKEVLQ